MRVKFITIRHQQVKRHIPFHELHKTFYCRCYRHMLYTIFHKLQHPFMQPFMNHFIVHSIYQIHCMVLHPFTMTSIRIPFSRTINMHSNQLKIVSFIPNRKSMLIIHLFTIHFSHVFTLFFLLPVQLPYAQAHQIHPSTSSSSSSSLNHYALDQSVANKAQPQPFHSTVNYYEQEYLTSQVKLYLFFSFRTDPKLALHTLVLWKGAQVGNKLTDFFRL